MFVDVTVGRSMAINAFVSLELPAGGHDDEWASAVRGLVEQRRWKGRSAVVLHAVSRAEHHIVDSPPGTSAETTVLVERQLQEILSQPIERFLSRLLRLRGTTVESLPRANTLAVLVPLDEITLVCKTVSDAGLSLVGLATLPLALLTAAGGIAGTGVEALVHLDRGVGTVAFVSAGVLVSQLQMRYGTGEESGAIDPGIISAQVEQALAGYRDRNPDDPIKKLHLTGWDATSEVFEMLTASGHIIDVISTPRMSVAKPLQELEGMDGLLYAHALLLWCGTRPIPANLVPRSVARPAQIRRLSLTVAAVAATFAGLLMFTARMLGEQHRSVEADLATAQAGKDGLAFDLALEAAEAEGQRQLELVGQFPQNVPDVAAFLSSLSVAAGDDIVLGGLAIVREGNRHRAKISGRAFGQDAAAAQAEFDRFVTAIRARATRELTVGELKLDRENESGQIAAPVGLRFELKLLLREKT